LDAPIELTARYTRAVDLARTLHAGELRKGTPIPYLAHPLSVSALVLEHGGSEDQAIAALLHDTAEDHGGSARIDQIRADFGEDVAYLNQVLEHVFARLPVDPARLAIGGFSDGASYALSLGLANGDLFPRVVAFSPGFVIGAPPHGRPRFFLSHGTADQILPIDRCSRVIVPQLRTRGYDVTFREFEGRHELPPDIAADGLRWMLNG